MSKLNRFWDHNSKLISRFIEIFYSDISDKYNLIYRDYPIYIKLEAKEDYKKIVGDCYKQSLHLSSNHNYLGIMRPEFTYMAAKEINLNSENLYYIGECYRNETTQFLRYQNFTQLGCELFGTTLAKGIAATYLTMAHLKEVLELINFNKTAGYVLHIKTDYDHIQQIARQFFPNLDIKFNELKRIGGDEHNYTYFCFELHAYKLNKPDKQHEVIGGGAYNITYKQNNIYAVGYSIGMERFIHYILNEQTKEEQEALISHILKYHQDKNSGENKKFFIELENYNSMLHKLNDICQHRGKITYQYIKR